MTNPTPTRAEVERFGCDQLGMDKMPDGEWVRFTDYQAAIQRAEAAERDRLLMAQKYDEEHPDPALMAKIIMANIENRFVIEDLKTALTEARASAALAWEAGRDAAAADVAHFGRLFLINGDNVTVDIRRDLAALTPPDDLSAALTARLDAELERAMDALQPLKKAARDAGLQDRLEGIRDAEDRIRALRRAAPTEGEA